MKEIFVSYRRGGAYMHTNRLFDALKYQFGESSVFLDVKSIDPGVKYADFIRNTIKKAKVVLVIIGPEWLELTDTEGNRRLEDESDLLTVEVKTALDSKALVIPVLVGGAESVNKARLPAMIRELADLHDIALTDSHWDYDVDQLINRIRAKIGGASPVEPKPAPAEEKKFSGKVIAGIVLISLSILAYGMDEIYDYDSFVGAVFLLIIGCVLSFWGVFDSNRQRVKGRTPGIVFGVLGILMILALFGGIEEYTDMPPEPDPAWTYNSAPAGAVPEIPDPPVQPQTVITNVSGVWGGSNGLVYNIIQDGNRVSFQEMNLLTGMVVGTGAGTISGQVIILAGGSGRLQVSPDGSLIQGNYMNPMTGLMVPIVLSRQQ